MATQRMTNAEEIERASVPAHESPTERALRVVRSSGGRITSSTRMVIEVLAGTPDHLTAEDLIAEVEGRLPGISPSTVYRVIQRLTELDVVEHVHTSVGPPIYHLHEHGHAHLVCNGCGKILDIADDHLDDLRSALSGSFGFTLDPHHSALVGHCDDCVPTHTGHHHH